MARIDEPDKNWKFSANDAKERAYWDDYQQAFSEVLSNTSTEWAPWYVIPADDKPLARVAAAGVIADALIRIDPRYPTVSPEARAALQAAKVELEAEAPPGAAPDPMEAQMAGKAAETGRGGKDRKRRKDRGKGRDRGKDGT
jgi:hypothetical protein